MEPVIRKDRESLNSLLRRFKKRSKDLLQDHKKYRYYESPAAERHRKDQQNTRLEKRANELLKQKQLKIKQLKKGRY